MNGKKLSLTCLLLLCGCVVFAYAQTLKSSVAAVSAGGTNLSLQIDALAVSANPEPATLALLSGTLAMVSIMVRYRKHR
ncbi:MAG: PEP-CTERM sorting domain-containing protein [Opitutales bacterium]